MEPWEDDPRRPLLGRQTRAQDRLRRSARKLCSAQSWRRRLPISIWLPQYQWSYLPRDIIAGVTVGLTSIPQGIAYAIIAGLPPQVGLYSSIFPGLVYAVFGSVTVVTVGPTAILAALLAKYVAVSPDFAYLASFLSGCIILLLGVLQLGFLLDFVSKPVISGFTAAAALQIAAAQLKALFRLDGKSGDTFVSAIENFIRNIKTVHLWDTVLGFTTIALLLALKSIPTSRSTEHSALRSRLVGLGAATVRARNALVVALAAIVAYCCYARGLEPFALTGKIEGGLPHFGPPPFSTTVGNTTLHFGDMLSVFGYEGLVMPLVAILESIAIARAFVGGSGVDSSQEMVAVGLSNAVASCCGAMPATGSFTRTALNHASGVATPAGSFFKAMLVLVSVTALAPAFYFIPRATLAGVIMVAMMYLMDYNIVKQLWTHSKCELCVYLVTLCAGLWCGLEYGILAGALADLVRALRRAARPSATEHSHKIGNRDCVTLVLCGELSYPSAGWLASRLGAALHHRVDVLLLDCAHLTAIDVGVAESIASAVEAVELGGVPVLLWNMSPRVAAILTTHLTAARLVNGHSIDHHVLCLDNEADTFSR